MATAGNVTNERVVAHKLHRQFGHPRPEKLIKLIRNAKQTSVNLEKQIRLISDSCMTCLKFKRSQPRPIVCFPLADRFNEMIGMDLKSWGEKFFLVIVDIATRFCAAYLINNKQPNTIVKALFITWFSIFGPPQKIISDNGGEFKNSVMWDMGTIFNIKLLTTAAESPWSNGIVERLNQVLADMVRKIMDDVGCDVQIALAWAVAARNVLSNRSGFSPNQLVFGTDPAFPDFFNGAGPGIEMSSADLVRMNGEARAKAREIFIKYESQERIRKALRYNIRPTPLDDLRIGDKVLYKRKDSRGWPAGTVIHINFGAKTVLVQPENTEHYVKVHSSSITKCPMAGDIDDTETPPTDIEDLEHEAQILRRGDRKIGMLLGFVMLINCPKLIQLSVVKNRITWPHLIHQKMTSF